jgi:hypothetical protein
MSLGVVANFYREKFAIWPFMEMAARNFDEVVMVSSPPKGREDEECCQMVTDFGARLVRTSVDRGFGVLRSRCIRESSCDWVVIMDCDEEIAPPGPQLHCHGFEKYPDVPNPELSVSSTGATFNTMVTLRSMIHHLDESFLAIRMCRRHWFDGPGTFERPCQNWQDHPDWQLRCVRNSPFVCYDPAVRLHERLIDTRTWTDPKWKSGNTLEGPFLEHKHHYYKSLEPEQMEEDIKIYESLDHKGTQDMWVKIGFNKEGAQS